MKISLYEIPGRLIGGRKMTEVLIVPPYFITGERLFKFNMNFILTFSQHLRTDAPREI